MPNDTQQVDSPFADALRGGAPASGPAHVSATDPKAIGAKVLQSATFGFAADAIKRVSPESAAAVRQLANQYDDQHPLAAFGIDLAVGMAETAATGGMLGEARGAQLAARTGTLVGRAAVGAGVGAATGMGSGGSMDSRTSRAKQGAVEGAVMGLGLGLAGKAAMGLLDRSNAVSSQARAAYDQIVGALKKDGMTVEQAKAKLQANPDLRIADLSGSVRELARKAASTSDANTRRLGDSVKDDAERQAGRLNTQTPSLQALKQQLMDNLEKKGQARDAAYKATRAEVMPRDAEMDKFLKSGTIAPLWKQVNRELKEGFDAGRLPALPKYHTNTEVPVLALDMLQRKIGEAGDDALGHEHAGTLAAIQRRLKDAGHAESPAYQQAQQLSQEVGDKERALQWGSQFAHGMKTADIEEFRALSPKSKIYAQLGAANGMERYLREHTRLTEGALGKIADRMDDPLIHEVMGKQAANSIKRTFKAEEARARNSTEMVGTKSKRVEFEKENQDRMEAHVANVVGGHAVGTVARVLAGAGMSGKQAQSIIDIATKPGGLQRLQDAGVDAKLIQKIRAALPIKGLAATHAVSNNSGYDRQ